MNPQKTVDNMKFISGGLLSLSFFNIALIVNYYATHSATKNALTPVPDTILNAIPVINTSLVDYWAPLFVIVITCIALVYKPNYCNLLIRSSALLIILRAFFINLTQLGIPANITPTQSFFTQGGDLFFSGHVALPCLVMFIFWKEPFLKILFFCISLFFATEVLLGHYHYSIDVFSAPFFAYCVFVFSKKYLI